MNSEVYEVAESEEKLPDLREKLLSVQARLLRQEQTLGVVGRAQYHHLATSPFIALRMNAHALKLRLWKRLTSRKFERDRIERAFRCQQYNGMAMSLFLEGSFLIVAVFYRPQNEDTY